MNYVSMGLAKREFFELTAFVQRLRREEIRKIEP